MAQNEGAICFLGVSLPRFLIITHQDMKKILLIITAMGMLMSVLSCNNDDEPGGDGVFNVNTPMVNHIVNQKNGNVIGMSSTHNRLTLDTLKHQASVELTYNDGNGDKTVKVSNLTATATRLGFYVLKGGDNSQVKDFSGYVDFNESSIRYAYTTNDGIRVISTIADVFFLKTKNYVTYDDTTAATSMDNVMYQFTLNPAQKTAIVKVMDIVHAKDWKRFINITASSVPVTVTTNGYVIAGENLNTNATYIAHSDSASVSPGVKQTDKYPFQVFNAIVDLENDSIIANYMIGSSATVVASGRTYPNYTAY